MKDLRETEPRYLIGIDLGTTQSAVSYFDSDDPEAGIRSLPVLQRVSAREVSPFPTLPSVAYLAEDTLELPAFEGEVQVGVKGYRPIVGHWARELGSQVPARLVTSAKSWLCHPRIDREAAILPWQSETVQERISPVTAAMLYLSHMKQIWNKSLGADGEDQLFERQKIVVTVPASFDPVARNLTLKAVEQAGFPPVTLLEEPQAAFYDFLHRHQQQLHTVLHGVKTVLVIDIGGGTTDFSLIGVEWTKESRAGKGHPELTRLAVGPHLLIGGDNFDLTLAHAVEARLRERGRKLVTRQWQALLYQAREVKERLLSQKSPEKVAFHIPGAGSRVIAQALKEELDAAPLKELLLGGFFPEAKATDRPDEDTGLGISDAGLPFTRDPAITRHLAAFLADNRVFPDAVLFNGGTTLSPALRDRLLQQLNAWAPHGKTVTVLENPYPTMAVAHGAVYFAQVTTGTGLRIRSGSPNSIYLGIGTDPKSTPTRHVPESLICLLPKGAEAETEHHIASKIFGIDRRRPVAFYLYYSGNSPRGESVGDLIEFQSRRHRPLPPLRPLIDKQQAREQTPEIEEVQIAAILRETGFLQILCRHCVDGRTEELAFDLSQSGEKEKRSASSEKPAKTAPGKRQVGILKKCIDSLFDKKQPVPFPQVFKKLEEMLAQPRQDWDLPLLRSIYDLLIEDERFFGSNEGRQAWLRLCGFALRPGYGFPGDDDRVERLWALHETPFESRESALWAEWWILWKRLAPGLSGSRQMMLAHIIESLLFGKTSVKGSRTPEQHERNQLWRLLGQLERLPAAEKERLGFWILKAPTTFSRDAMALLALGRLGARELAYADHTHLVPKMTVQSWVESLLPRTIAGSAYLEWALREMGRRCADRLIQIDDSVRKRIIDRFKKENRKRGFLAPLLEIQHLEPEELTEFLGEALPSGFVWARDRNEPDAGEAPTGSVS